MNIVQGSDCFWGIHDNHWGAPGIWIFFLVTIIVTTLILNYLMRFSKWRGDSYGKEAPIDILKRRYANGEITSEAFKERKRVLDNN